MGNTDFKLTTPVAFLIFNRPDTTARVFAEIRRARPPRLLVVADGPRAGHPSDEARCKEARKIIEGVDWPCEVTTHFSDVNLGCRRRMSSGVDWVFQTVPEAILLEDDCVPHPDFFRYCQELLARYRDDERVMMIGGANFQFGRRESRDSYYFSRFAHIWGWASWRRAWAPHYDVDMKRWPEFRDAGGLEKLFGDRQAARYWTKTFDACHAGLIDTWDYQLMFANFLYGKFSATPSVNMITNIGFGPAATHTQAADNERANMRAEGLEFPLTHPRAVAADAGADAFVQRKFFRPTLGARVAYKLKSVLARFY